MTQAADRLEELRGLARDVALDTSGGIILGREWAAKFSWAVAWMERQDRELRQLRATEFTLRGTIHVLETLRGANESEIASLSASVAALRGEAAELSLLKDRLNEWEAIGTDEQRRTNGYLIALDLRDAEERRRKDAEAEVEALRGEREHARNVTAQMIDSCFCDDGRDLPECEACMRLRRVWAALDGKGGADAPGRTV